MHNKTPYQSRADGAYSNVINQYFRVQPSAAEYAYFIDNKELLLNGLLERDPPREEYSDNNKLTLVRRFCELVGIPDTVTPGAEFNTLAFTEGTKMLANEIIAEFQQQPRPVKSNRSLMSVFETMLEHWTGTMLSSESVRSSDTVVRIRNIPFKLVKCMLE